MNPLRDCGAKRNLAASAQDPDRVIGGRVVAGVRHEIWSTCGKARGHSGIHGTGGSVRRLLRKVGLIR